MQRADNTSQAVIDKDPAAAAMAEAEVQEAEVQADTQHQEYRDRSMKLLIDAS